MESEAKTQTPQPELAQVIINEETNIRLGNDPETATNEAIATAEFLKKTLIDNKSEDEILIDKNGKRYIAFTEWQTLGNYYQVSVRTEVVEYDGKGRNLVVKARGIATYIPTGQCVGSAEAFCERSEKGKGKHNLNQIASMAQTRAGSKAMRNALGWVVELAGMCSTPAEEMEGILNQGNTVERTQQPAPATEKKLKNKPKSSSRPKSSGKPRSSEEYVSEMPPAEKVRNPEPDEPDNVQEGQLTGESYWKQLAEENSTLHIVIATLTKNETPINKKNILETSADLIGEGVIDAESRRSLLTFLQDKNEPD